jgi:hypothetical protein
MLFLHVMASNTHADKTPCKGHGLRTVHCIYVRRVCCVEHALGNFYTKFMKIQKKLFGLLILVFFKDSFFLDVCLHLLNTKNTKLISYFLM